jgi:glycosyltransferase involved in cell wall biosynthesis
VEILISDNASTDDTESVCRQAAVIDARIRYFRQPTNIGLYQNHNFLLGESRGDFVCFFHDHDAREPGMVREYVEFMQAHPEVGVVCSDWNVIDEAGGLLGVRDHPAPAITPGREFIERTIRNGRSSVGAPGGLIRRSALGDIRFDEHGALGFGDFVLWFRIAEQWSVGHIGRRLWSWRQEPHAQSVRRIVSLVDDYDRNISSFCEGFLARHPAEHERVSRWRQLMRRYIFWALVFEIGLHHRARSSKTESPTLFEIHRYDLTPQEFERALEQLAAYRTGADQVLVFAVLRTLLLLRLTWPLGWVTRHYGSMRTILGLR